MHPKVDFVPFASLLFGLMTFFTPIVALKENRVVDGELLSGGVIAGSLISGLAIVTALAITAIALFPDLFLKWKKADFSDDQVLNSLRRTVYILAACMGIWLSAALLVRANSMIFTGAAPRVSPALGFWGLPIASYILIVHAKLKGGFIGYFGLFLMLTVPTILILYFGNTHYFSLVLEYTVNKKRFLDETLIHLRLFSTAIVFAALIGIPLGIAASNHKRLSGPLIAFVDGAQTIPSMALFGLLLAPLAALSRSFPFLKAIGISGTGSAPALIALSLYALLPIVRNTIAGLADVPDSTMEAGFAMGMSQKQLFNQIRWPMALPFVLVGLRTASVQAVGNTAVAALIGAGGLGMLIFQGLGQAAPDLILLGVIPLIILAVFVDRIWGWLIRVWVSPGLRLEGIKQ